MRLMTKILAGAALLASVYAGPARAEAERYEFDKVHSQIIFFIKHMGFAYSEGEFLKFDGHIDFDQANPANSAVEVTIDTNSLDMDDATWDEHVKDVKLLNVAQYPTMTFKSTKIDVTGDNTADIHGDLTLLGVTKPVVLKTVLNKADIHPFSKKPAAGFSATTTIKRSEWGMTHGIPMVDDEMQIRIEVESAKAEAAPAEAATDAPAQTPAE